MRLLTLGFGRTASANRDLLTQALEALDGWHQITDRHGQLLWSSRSGDLGDGFSNDPAQPLRLWLQEALGEDREQLRRLHDLQSAAERAVAAQEFFRVPSPQRRELRVGVQPLAGPPLSLLWSLTASVPPAAEADPVPPALLDEAELGFYRADRQGRLLFLNEPLKQWLGHRRPEPDDKEVQLQDFLLEPADVAHRGKGLLPEAPAGSARSAELALRGADGGALRIKVTELPVAADGGQTIGLVKRLDGDPGSPATEGALQRLSEEAPVGVARLSAEGRVIECNKAFADFLDREAAGATGQLLSDLIEPPQRAALTAALEELAARGSAASGTALELRMGRPVGRIASLVLRRLSGVEGLGAYLLDLTEQKTLEARAAQSEKMQAVGQLAGGIAHDFNNLLTAIIGFSDLLLARHRPGDPSFGEIMQIKQNANRAAGLIRQLLAFSRQQSLQPRVLSLTNILEDITHLLRRLIGQKVELEVVHERDLWPVKADQGQLEQVIINLAINARDAMERGGVLQIQTSNLQLKRPRPAAGETVPKGDYVLLEVKDNGEGIPPENLERVFEPFFSTKEVGEGTGLGLSTVYGIVKQTGGYISLESEVGAGTRLLIYLPRHAGAIPQEMPEEQPRLRDLTGRGRILLVEDEDAVRTFSAAALRNKGYEVLEASSGDEALQRLQAMEEGEEEGLDLLITDVVMPRVDGPTLVQAARKRRPSLKVIYISGYAEDSLRAQLGQEQRRAHYLPKPFSLKQLAARVKEVMQESDNP